MVIISNLRALIMILRQRGGFYVESGGYTGEGLSNSLLFETQRDWQGILIEPDSKNFAKLVTRNRKTHTAHACLADSHTTKNVS